MPRKLYVALAVFVLIVLMPALHVSRVPLRAFVKMVKDPVLLAFATTSSESAMPSALSQLERFGVPRRIAGFVLPMGYSFTAVRNDGFIPHYDERRTDRWNTDQYEVDGGMGGAIEMDGADVMAS